MEENSVTQEGFPFGEDAFNPKSDSKIKSHFDDLTKKHPQFVDDLHCPPWSGSMDKDWERAYTVPISVEQDEIASVETVGASSSESPYCSLGNRSKPDPTDSSSQPSLRHTIDIAEQIQKDDVQKLESEPKRSSSAPPDPSFVGNREPKRFTTKIEITPINPFEPTSAVSSDENGIASPISHADRTYSGSRQVPISADHQPCYQDSGESTQPTKDDTFSGGESFVNVTDKSHTGNCQIPPTNRNQPHVRHIPIFVEGRTEPVVPSHETVSSEKKLATADQAPLKRKLDGSSANECAATETSTHSNQNHESAQGNENRLETEVTSATITPSASAPFSVPASPSRSPVPRLDSQQCIEQVQQEVDSLTKCVEQYSGTSRDDKEYLYLDEMLTRTLIKLDTIEVEGNEQLRTARRNVIKSIQKSIALLESKIPVSIQKNECGFNSSERNGESQPTSDVFSMSCEIPMEADSNKISEGNENNEMKV